MDKQPRIQQVCKTEFSTIKLKLVFLLKQLYRMIQFWLVQLAVHKGGEVLELLLSHHGLGVHRLIGEPLLGTLERVSLPGQHLQNGTLGLPYPNVNLLTHVSNKISNFYL